MSLFPNTRPSWRDILKQSGMLTALSAATPLRALGAGVADLEESSAASHAPTEISHDNLFTRTGVRPILNARGTYTIITGSRSLPQVKQAMLEASNYFVHLDELMPAGEEHIVADATYVALTQPGHYETPVVPQGAPAQLAGTWAVEIKYKRGIGEQRFTLKQDGNTLTGTQSGEVYHTELKGTVHADHLELTSEMAVSGNSIPWTFRGIISGNSITSTVHMGEYGEATWVAVKS